MVDFPVNQPLIQQFVAIVLILREGNLDRLVVPDKLVLTLYRNELVFWCPAHSQECHIQHYDVERDGLGVLREREGNIVIEIEMIRKRIAQAKHEVL